MPEAQAAATENTAPVKPAKIEQNGVVRPKAGTATARIWDIADAISAAASKPAGRAEVLAKAKSEGLNEATAATQFGRWCKFYGVKPEPRPKAEPKPKKPKAEVTAPAPAPVEAAPVAEAQAPAPAPEVQPEQQA